MSAPPTRSAPRGRLNPILRVVLYLPALGLVGSPLALLAILAWRALVPLLQLPATPFTPAQQVEALAPQAGFVVGTVLVTYLYRRMLDRRSFSSLGFERWPGWVQEGLLGFGLGVLLMTVILAVELALGAYRFEGPAWQARPLADILAPLLPAFLIFVVVAFNEELIARGYLLQNIAAGWGQLAGVLLSSALFAAAHLANPGAGPISTAGLFFAGLLLAGGYVVTRRLWLPIGLHLSWNFFQGPVYGFPVSGVEAGGLLVLGPVGPDALTGGPFGPEASLIGVGAELLGIALLWLWARRRSSGPVRRGPSLRRAPASGGARDQRASTSVR